MDLPTLTLSITRVIGVVLVILVAIFVMIRQPGWRAPRYPMADRADASILEKHVRFLTTDAFPRCADDPESLDLAAAYVAAELRHVYANMLPCEPRLTFPMISTARRSLKLRSTVSGCET